MASFIISNSASSSLYLPHISPSPPQPLLYSPGLRISQSVSFSGELRSRKTRGSSVVTAAGPGASTFVFAFVFPLSLLAGTIFTSIRIADKLDNEFMEELAVNQAILEAADQDDDVANFLEEETAVPRTRNRPKREAEPSSM